MTNLQTGVPVLGDLPLLNKTYYSIELYAEHLLPDTNETMRFFLEEDVYWDGEKESWEWVFGRLEEFWVVDFPGERREWEGEGMGDGDESRSGKGRMRIQPELK